MQLLRLASRGFLGAAGRPLQVIATLGRLDGLAAPRITGNLARLSLGAKIDRATGLDARRIGQSRLSARLVRDA